MRDGITACLAAIPPRVNAADGLPRALMSVTGQTLAPTAINVKIDRDREGVWVMRQRLIESVQTSWLAWLDDDDEWEPEHLALLAAYAVAQRADYVYSYFHTNMADPLGLFGHPFDPDAPTHTTGVILVKTDLAQAVGYTAPHPDDIVAGEDWRFTLGCVKQGATIVHLPRRTWRWWYHEWSPTGPNTSGRPTNW